MPFPKSETVRGYTAGILDGEGSIMIVKFKNPTSKRGYTYQLKVVVVNTNEWLCHWLKMQYEGTIQYKKSKRPQEKDIYEWRLVSQQAKRFLEYIAPYLIIKKAQAEIAIRFQTGRGRGKPQTDAESVIDEIERNLMQGLNSKGVH